MTRGNPPRIVWKRKLKTSAAMKGCWKAYNHLSPQEQLSAANQLRNSNLESAVNPSAYFLKMINKARYSTPKAGSSATAPTSKGTRPVKVISSLSELSTTTHPVLQAMQLFLEMPLTHHFARVKLNASHLCDVRPS